MFLQPVPPQPAMTSSPQRSENPLNTSQTSSLRRQSSQPSNQIHLLPSQPLQPRRVHRSPSRERSRRGRRRRSLLRFLSLGKRFHNPAHESLSLVPHIPVDPLHDLSIPLLGSLVLLGRSSFISVVRRGRVGFAGERGESETGSGLLARVVSSREGFTGGWHSWV
ncbi:hypothetical protein BDY24DRAFT_394131 [Mrakia frigida]|uniref:uncharacterized protein n=1 Tax=Mrakia frigida TaxID=29902 RepID=UPI003FCBFBDC